MNKLKNAYNDFMAALKEETGLNPSITINFFCHSYGNEAGKYIPAAASTAYHIASQLGLPEPTYQSSKNYEWFKSENYEMQTDFAFHM